MVKIKKTTKTILATSTIIFIALLIVAGFKFGFFQQTFIGLFDTKTACTNQAMGWCGMGFSCQPCFMTSYTNTTSQQTQIKYTTECFSDKSVSNDICQQSALVISHSTYKCYNNNLYWYKSNGVREELKETCTYGCELVSTYLSRCKPATETCSNECSPNGYAICTDETHFKTCGNFDADPCLEYKTQTCPSGKVCFSGICKDAEIVEPECSAGETTCLSGTTYKKCSSSGTWGSKKTCQSGYECSGTSCIKIATPIATPVEDTTPQINLCENVVCQDKCEEKTLYSQGTCDQAFGTCKYGKIEINSESCIPPKPEGTSIPILVPILLIGMGIIIYFVMKKKK